MYNITVSFSNRANGKKVVLGVHSLSEAEDTKQTFDILEANLHKHPNFNPLNYDNDITLIKVSSEQILSVFYTMQSMGVSSSSLLAPMGEVHVITDYGRFFHSIVTK